MDEVEMNEKILSHGDLDILLHQIWACADAEKSDVRKALDHDAALRQEIDSKDRKIVDLRYEIADWRELLIWARRWSAVGVVADPSNVFDSREEREATLKRIDAKLAEPAP